ncbi:MAG TPA: tellurite resistance TerB family protein [Rhizomicrobium sp.]|jgi:tellurite resistance protein|nr:tellurite resistance TerB family protein [Rhizomicrobium sp.]
MNAISHHAALVYVMVVVSASDGNMSESELRTIGDIVRTLPVFRDFDHHRLLSASRECADILQEPDGLDAVMGLIRDALPESLRETAYWLALEVALTDAQVKLEEVRMVELLRRCLSIDRLTAAALDRAAEARYRAE